MCYPINSFIFVYLCEWWICRLDEYIQIAYFKWFDLIVLDPQNWLYFVDFPKCFITSYCWGSRSMNSTQFTHVAMHLWNFASFCHTGLAQKSKQYKKRKTLHLNFFRCQLCISHLPQSCSSTWYPRPGTIETNYWIFTFFVSNLSFFQMYAVCNGIYEYRFPCCCLTHNDKHEWIQLMCLWGRLFLTDINLWTPLMSVFRIAQETSVNINICGFSFDITNTDLGLFDTFQDVWPLRPWHSPWGCKNLWT